MKFRNLLILINVKAVYVDNVKHCIDLVIVTIKRFTVVMIVTIVR